MTAAPGNALAAAGGKNDTARGILFMLLSILGFTLMDAIAKGLVLRYPVAQIVWIRFAGQALIVALILGPRLFAMLRSRYPLLHLARALCQLGATFCFFSALPHIGLAEASALTDLNPIFITVGAAIFLGESLGPRRMIGVLVAMAGAMIVIRPGMAVFTPASLLPLAAALFFTANALLTRHLGPVESYWTPMILTPVIGAAVLAPAQPFVWQAIPAGDLPVFAAIGVFGTIAQLFMIRAFSLAEAGAVAPFAYMGILFAAIWGVLFYGEWPDGPTVIGALVIVGAGLYVWHRETRAARSA